MAASVLDDGADASTVMLCLRLRLRMGMAVLSANEWHALPTDEAIAREVNDMRGRQAQVKRTTGTGAS